MKKKIIKCKIFLTEMGWGPIVRQSSICNQLSRLGNFHFTVQSAKNHDIIKKFFPVRTDIKKFGNITKFFSLNNGRVDFLKTKKYYNSYNHYLKLWFKENLKDCDYDFFISDVCPEAFELGRRLEIPCFGIGHFTWDWFFSQTIPAVVNQSILSKWKKFQATSKNFFFPPFTPRLILNNHKRYTKVDFILSHKIKKYQKTLLKKNKKIKILFLDSGDKIVTPSLKKIIKKNRYNNNFLLMHTENMGKFKNTFSIPKNEFLGDYIPHADIIIGRAGFNTITEILYFNKPAIFLTSDNNPEINWNLSQMIALNLAHSLDIQYLESNFEVIINDYKNFHINQKKEYIRKQKFKFNGANQIAKEILKKI